MKYDPEFCERVHAYSLRLLEQIGVRVDHADVRDELLKAGARPGRETGAIVFPRELVEERLQLAPSTARFADGHGKITELKSGKGVTFWTPASLNIREGREQGRAIGRADLAHIAQVVEHYDNIFAVTGTAVAEEPPKTRDFCGFRIMANHTRSHLRPLIFSKDGVVAIMEMAQVLLGSRQLSEYPIFSLGYSILSPFHWSEIPLNMWWASRGHAIPVMINGEPIAGVTSPITLAGSVAQSNAEILSGIVINQVLEPGRPCVFNLGFAHVMDMQTTLCLSASPECALLAEAGAYMAHHYNLPSASWMSTDSVPGNGQATAERMFNGLIHARAGVNIIWGIGQLESQKTVSLTQMILDNDLIGYILQYLRGFDQSDEAFAIEEILSQRFAGNYLDSDHTLSNFKQVLHRPDIFVRQFANRSPGSDNSLPSSLDAENIAAETLARIIKDAPDSLLDEAVDHELAKIEKRWKDALA